MTAPASPRRRFRFPIRFKILLSLLVVITVVVSAITYTMANLFHDDKKTYIRDLASIAAVHAAAEVNSVLLGYSEHLRVFARVMRDAELPPREKSRLLEGLFEDFPEFIAVTFYRDGQDAVTVYDAESLRTAGMSKEDLQAAYAQHPLPFDRIDRERPHIADFALRPSLPALIFVIATPAADGAKGYIGAVIHKRTLLRVTRREGTFEIFLLDGAGKVLSGPEGADAAVDARAEWLPSNMPQLLGLLKQGRTAATSAEYLAGGVETIGGFASVDTGGLVLGAQIAKSAAYLTARDLLNNLTIVALMLLIIAALVSLLWSRRITRPVERLTEAALSVGKGDFAMRVDIDTHDEMGELAQSFNQMTDELHAREEALKQAQAALIQSEKMSAFGQLSAGIAHEVKNPLAGILGYAQLSLRKLDPDHPTHRHLALIEKETKRCRAIIDNLMKFARQEKVAMEPIDINQTVEDACAIVDHQLTINQVKLHKELSSALPRCLGNANQLQQVLMNLMINAQQAMDGKAGTVTVSTRATDGPRLEIRITDTGPGIPQEIQAKIFEPFFTTKPTGKGTGLGLSVSYGIIRDHQGEIRVESQVGQGASFIITLPLIEPRATPAT